MEDHIYSTQAYKQMLVKITYRDDLPGIPLKFDVTATGGSVSKSWVFSNVKPAAAPYQFKGHGPWVEMRGLIAAMLPIDRPPESPYAFLDEVMAKSSLRVAIVSDATDFTDNQKEMIRMANALYSTRKNTAGAAFLTSDEPLELDSIQTLNQMGGLDRPQIDHVYPKSRGGNNSFGNAMVISKQRNNSKSARLSELQEEEHAEKLASARRGPTRGAKSYGTKRRNPY
jgi:hypothetical protein